MMWVGMLNDEELGKWYWKFRPALAIAKNNIDIEPAAVYMLIEYWQREAKIGAVDHYHWINEAEFLSVAQINAMAGLVWPEH